MINSIKGLVAAVLTVAIMPAQPLAAEQPPVSATASAPTLAVQRTRLKAKAGERENLAKYLIANWFEMDRKGVEAGIFTFYRLLENPDENAEWDFLVEVGYPNADGYDDPDVQMAFGKIREAHVEVLVDGKTLSELGSFVSNDRLILRYESD